MKLIREIKFEKNHRKNKQTGEILDSIFFNWRSDYYSLDNFKLEKNCKDTKLHKKKQTKNMGQDQSKASQNGGVEALTLTQQEITSSAEFLKDYVFKEKIDSDTQLL